MANYVLPLIPASDVILPLLSILETVHVIIYKAYYGTLACATL